MKKKSPVSPSFLKQKARQLQKENPLSRSQALDEIAKEYGYSNYRNYLNTSETNGKQAKPSKEVYLKKISLETDMDKKVDLIISFVQNFKLPFHEQLNIFKLCSQSDNPEAIQVICKKLNLMKDEIQTHLLNDLLTDEGKADIHSMQPYFIAKEINLSDLTYEINSDLDMLWVNGDYDIKTEFEPEIDEDDPTGKDARFNDRELFGSFEITINRNKKINLIYSEIGENFDEK